MVELLRYGSESGPLLSSSYPSQKVDPRADVMQGKADDYEIAAAQIGVEVYSAMNSALSL